MTEISIKKELSTPSSKCPNNLIENSKFIEQHWEPHQNIQIRMMEEQEEHFKNIKHIILVIEDGRKIKLEDFDKFMETVELFGLKTKILKSHFGYLNGERSYDQNISIIQLLLDDTVRS